MLLAFCNWNPTVIQGADLLWLLTPQVAAVPLHAHNFSTTGYLEPVGRTFMRF
jgi:hypothetical protein